MGTVRKPLYMGSEGFSIEMPATDNLQLGGLAMSGVITMGGFDITGLPANPFDATAAASKAYVDSVAQGLIIKSPVHVVAVANIALTGLYTIDGHPLVASDRVLATSQTAVKFSGTGDSLAGPFVKVTSVALTTLGGTTHLTDPGAAFVTEDVGKLITVSGASDVLNDGTFTITSRVGSTEITYVNPTPGADESGGSLDYLSNDVRLTDAGATFTIAQEHEKIIFTGTTGGLNNGTFEIRKYISGTAVIFANPTGVTETSAFTYTGEIGIDNGIWVAAAGAWARAADMPAASHASHAFMFVEVGTLYANTGWVCTDTTPEDVVGADRLTFVQFSSAGVIDAGAGLVKVGNTISVKQGDGIDLVSNSAATNIALATNPGLALTGTSPNKLLTALVESTGGVQIDGASGLALLLNGTTLQTNGSGVSVKGLPNLFEIGTVATSQTPGTGQVTAANLNTLTAGSASNADALHVHSVVSAPFANRIENLFAVVEAVTVGQPVYQSATSDQVGVAQASNDAKSRVIGIARIGQSTPGLNATIVEHGPCTTVLTGSPTANTPFYLAPSGGLTTSRPIGGNRVILIGFAKNATDLHVTIIDYGKAA
jgi:hypothetical protein